MKKIVYVDMDNVLVDFVSGINQLDAKTLKNYEGRFDDVPGIFSLMTPIADAIATIRYQAQVLRLNNAQTLIQINPKLAKYVDIILACGALNGLTTICEVLV